MIREKLRETFDDFRNRGGADVGAACGLACLVDGGLDDLALPPKLAERLKQKPVARLYNPDKGDLDRVAIICDSFSTDEQSIKEIGFVNQFTSLNTSFIKYWNGPVLHINLDIYAQFFADGPNLLLALLSAHVKPRLILNVSGSPAGKENLRAEVLVDIKRKHGPAIVSFMNDLVSDFWRAQASIHLLTSDLVVSSDISLADTGIDPPAGRWIHLWHIIDENHYAKVDALAQDDRDIGIGLYGRMSGHGFYRVHRLGLARVIQNAGLPLHVHDATPENFLDYAGYLALLKRTKIRLSPSEAGLVGAFDRPFGKAPVVVHRHMNFTPWEAFMSGAIVLDSDDVSLPKFMRPGVEFVHYANVKELVDKARYYLREESERREIVGNARDAMRLRYSSVIYWTLIVERLHEVGDFDLSDAFQFADPGATMPGPAASDGC